MFTATYFAHYTGGMLESTAMSRSPKVALRLARAAAHHVMRQNRYTATSTQYTITRGNSVMHGSDFNPSQPIDLSVNLNPNYPPYSRYDDEPSGSHDLSDDAAVLASAGWGTDEDYGYFGHDDN